jgi:molecular chaperone GrpE
MLESLESAIEEVSTKTQELEKDAKESDARRLASKARQLGRHVKSTLADATHVSSAVKEIVEKNRRHGEEIEKLKKENGEITERLVYLKSDFENFRKRSEKESYDSRDRAREGVILSILEVLDNFERALATGEKCSDRNFVKGVEMIYNMLLQNLGAEGLTVIPAKGETFDPFRHEAVERVHLEDKANNEIVQEIQKGYMLGTRVIRPSKVKVNIIIEKKEEVGEISSPTQESEDSLEEE